MKARLGCTVAVSAVVATLVAMTACGPVQGGPGTGTTTQGTGTSTIDPGGGSTTGQATIAPAPPGSEPTASVQNYKITYGWAVPSTTASIRNTVNIPIGGPSEPPLPYLVGIYVGDHPEGNPRYQRVSFYFRGALPSYNLAYVAKLTDEGRGAPVALTGNAVLRIGFVDAQAHDNNGASTVKATPKNPIGYQNLKSYAFAGDFEGHVTYGLGLQVAAGSDQALKIRAGQLKKSDGAGGSFYVVFVDVQTA